MNEEQESHLWAIKERFVSKLDSKYRAGQGEHGGNLWDRDVLTDAIDEAIDLVTYLDTADYKRRQAISLINNAIVLTARYGEELESVRQLLFGAMDQLKRKNK
jgi:hypothetical protein